MVDCLRTLQDHIGNEGNATVRPDPRNFSDRSITSSDIFQFIGFLAWYFVIIVCCFIPPCIIYRRRRLLMQNDARLRRALQQMVDSELRNYPTDADITATSLLERTEQITEALKSTTMIVATEDLLLKEETDANNEQQHVDKDASSEQLSEGEKEMIGTDDQEMGGFMGLESTLLQLGDMHNGRRQVPAVCAICLCSYEIGDSVSVSSNENCIHAFHTECAIMWLSKTTQTLCPCCRQEFCHTTSQRPIRADEAVVFRHLQTVRL